MWCQWCYRVIPSQYSPVSMWQSFSSYLSFLYSLFIMLWSRIRIWSVNQSLLQHDFLCCLIKFCMQYCHCFDFNCGLVIVQVVCGSALLDCRNLFPESKTQESFKLNHYSFNLWSKLRWWSTSEGLVERHKFIALPVWLARSPKNQKHSYFKCGETRLLFSQRKLSWQWQMTLMRRALLRENQSSCMSKLKETPYKRP